MSDCEEGDFFWESLISPEQKKKRKKKKKKKNSQKTEQKCPKQKNIKSKTDEKKKKKKTKINPEFKEAMEALKEKKQKKKKKLSVDSFIFTQSHSRSQPEPEPEGSDHLLQNSKTKSTRKKVAFALSPDHIAAKRPKFTSSSPKEIVEREAPRFEESCSQVKVTPANAPPHDLDSQCTSDDINSQDLFITQKTFRTSPVESSSGEAFEKKAPPPAERKLLSPEGPAASGLQQRLKTSKDLTLLKREDEMFYLRPNSLKRERLQRKTSRGASPLLEDPLDLPKTKIRSCSSSRPVSSSCPSEDSPPPQVTSASTQTENFFTTELSSYLGFCQTSRASDCYEVVEPLDLSLPHRVRNDLGPGKTASPKDAHRLRSSGSSDVKVKTEQQTCSIAAQRKTKTTPSPQSDSQLKFSDTTTSSEDIETSSKLDLIQVRSVQMRLNESFFFKTKGDGRSHRPESPLMKLAQGRELKSKKGR